MVSTSDGPSVPRRQLGRRLRALREASGRTVEDVLAATDVASRSKLWRIESGRVAVKQGDVLALTRLYGTPAKIVDELLVLAEATKTPGLSVSKGDGVSQSLGLYAELEATAASVSAYSSELIHGLLQTADYVRSVIEADPMPPRELVEQKVSFRLERQQRFFGRSEQRRLEVVITAGAMNLQVGSPSVMEEQIAHLREINERGAARLSVLPATNGVHRAMLGPFVILDFDDEADPSVGYVENLIDDGFYERPSEVTKFREAFDRLRRQALPLEEWLR